MAAMAVTKRRRVSRARIAMAGCAAATASYALIDFSGGDVAGMSRRSLATMDRRDTPPVPLVQKDPSDLEAEAPLGTETTFLLGIFTTLAGDGDARRRNLIRETYLGTGDDRLCPLHEYRLMAEVNRSGCRVLYAFVAGASEEGPPENLGDLDAPTSVECPGGGSGEPDLVCLNISENVERGKSTTWIGFGADVPGVDYVAKTDSDTLINPALLLDFVERDLPSAPNNRRTYGGKTWANFKRSSVYMAGQFYFLSTDLARFVTRTLTADDRRALGGGARTALEDVDMGSYVFSHPRPIKLVSVAGSMFWWHPVRDEGSWGDLWKYRDATSPYRTPEMPYKELCEHWQGHSLLSEETYGALN